MQGSAKKNLLMFKRLCGDDALRKVVLVTTMWDKVLSREAEKKEKQLVDTSDFWGYMVSKGSTMYRHDNTNESAIRIVKKLARRNSTVTLEIQNQMINHDQNLSETAAGRALESDLIKERQKWAAELNDVHEQMMEAIRLRDKEMEKALGEVKDDFAARLECLQRDHEQVHIATKRLHDEKIKQLEEALEKQNKPHSEEIKAPQQKNVIYEEASRKDIEFPIILKGTAHRMVLQIWRRYLTSAAVYPMTGPHAITNRIQRGSHSE